jgi:hypothetical protein
MPPSVNKIDGHSKHHCSHGMRDDESLSEVKADGKINGVVNVTKDPQGTAGPHLSCIKRVVNTQMTSRIHMMISQERDYRDTGITMAWVKHSMHYIETIFKTTFPCHHSSSVMPKTGYEKNSHAWVSQLTSWAALPESAEFGAQLQHPKRALPRKFLCQSPHVTTHKRSA